MYYVECIVYIETAVYALYKICVYMETTLCIAIAVYCIEYVVHIETAVYVLYRMHCVYSSCCIV